MSTGSRWKLATFHILNPKVDQWMRVECCVTRPAPIHSTYILPTATVEVFHDAEDEKSTFVRCSVQFDPQYPVCEEGLSERVSRIHVYSEARPANHGYGLVAYLGAALYAQNLGFIGVGSYIHTVSRIGRGRSPYADRLWDAMARHDLIREQVVSDRGSLQMLLGPVVREYLRVRSALR